MTHINDPNFKDYADYYDLIYRDKDYEKEVDFIEEIFEDTHKPKRILEVGCGTGSYTKILLERGYEITAVDISEEMLKIARDKCACEFIKGDIKSVSINDKFDACIAMFAVISYITRNTDIIEALNNIRRHLKTNGIFIFDAWNGLAVMRNFPEQRIKELENDKMKVIRVAVPNLDSFDHLCEVNYKLLIINKENGTLNEIDEKHTVRFYFPQEIIHYLEDTGFEVLKISPFLDLKGKVDETVWNMTIIARAVGANLKVHSTDR
ncbi:Ubiquinone/menaquinone biosynthesis C-methyltransferase UbiE [uncultured archaeon]|nr:Ubiquinone/menaquinone biosynthesis C-methyltransferase UbiE [uncultured archaeon]